MSFLRFQYTGRGRNVFSGTSASRIQGDEQNTKAPLSHIGVSTTKELDECGLYVTKEPVRTSLISVP